MIIYFIIAIMALLYGLILGLVIMHSIKKQKIKELQEKIKELQDHIDMFTLYCKATNPEANLFPISVRHVKDVKAESKKPRKQRKRG